MNFSNAFVHLANKSVFHYQFKINQSQSQNQIVFIVNYFIVLNVHPNHPIPIPSSLLILPKYHFYWFQSRNPSFPSFCVIHFFEEPQTESHSILQSFLQMQSCSSHKHSLKPLLFAYIPQQSSYLSSIQSFLLLFQVEKIILISYTNHHSDLLKYFILLLLLY